MKLRLIRDGDVHRVPYRNPAHDAEYFRPHGAGVGGEENPDRQPTVTFMAEAPVGDYYKPVINEGESYYYTNGEWIDFSTVSNGLGNFCIRPVLEKRNPVTVNSTLSTNELCYVDEELSVDLNLNGNQLYSIQLKDTCLMGFWHIGTVQQSIHKLNWQQNHQHINNHK